MSDSGPSNPRTKYISPELLSVLTLDKSAHGNKSTSDVDLRAVENKEESKEVESPIRLGLQRKNTVTVFEKNRDLTTVV